MSTWLYKLEKELKMCLWRKADVEFYWIIVCAKFLPPKFIIRLLEGHFFADFIAIPNFYVCISCRAILPMGMPLLNRYCYYYYYCYYTCLFISSISIAAWIFTAFSSSLLFCSFSCTASGCALMDWISEWVLAMVRLTSD